MKEYCFGIYYYIDKETGNIVYIGKDSHIDKNVRRNAHIRPSAYNTQPFNRVLQNNPKRYEYNVYCHVSTIKELNQLEFDLINLYRPKFNFKHGGDNGINFTEDFKYNVVSGGHTRKGTKQYVIKNKNDVAIAYSINYEKIQTVAKALNDKKITEEQVKSVRGVDNVLRLMGFSVEREFKYSIAKAGFTSVGNRIYRISDKQNLPIIMSIDFDFLNELVIQLNNGDISEDEVRHYDRFKYKVNKARILPSGAQDYRILNKKGHAILYCTDPLKLTKIVEALNDEVIYEKDVKSVHGADSVLDLIAYETREQTQLQEFFSE